MPTKVANPTKGRARVFSKRHPNGTKAVDRTFDLIRNASVVVDEFVRAELGC